MMISTVGNTTASETLDNLAAGLSVVKGNGEGGGLIQGIDPDRLLGSGSGLRVSSPMEHGGKPNGPLYGQAGGFENEKEDNIRAQSHGTSLSEQSREIQESVWVWD